MFDYENSNLEQVLTHFLEDMKTNNKDAYTTLMTKVKDGFFKDHQTAGTIKNLANEITAKLK